MKDEYVGFLHGMPMYACFPVIPRIEVYNLGQLVFSFYIIVTILMLSTVQLFSIGIYVFVCSCVYGYMHVDG